MEGYGFPNRQLGPAAHQPEQTSLGHGRAHPGPGCYLRQRGYIPSPHAARIVERDDVCRSMDAHPMWLLLTSAFGQ
jgi:hypothetical protein